MKRAILIFGLFLLTSFGYAIEKGKFTVQFPIGLTNYSYSDLFSANGYGINFGHYHNGNDGYKSFAWGVSPKAGYFLSDNFVVGLSAKYWHLNEGNDIYQIYNLGIFTKLYFGDRKLKPFIEMGGVFGRHKEDQKQQGIFDTYFPSKFIIRFKELVGNGGVSYFINSNLSVDLYAMYRITWEKKLYYNSEKGRYNNLGLMAAFSYFF